MLSHYVISLIKLQQHFEEPSFVIERINHALLFFQLPMPNVSSEFREKSIAELKLTLSIFCYKYAFSFHDLDVKAANLERAIKLYQEVPSQFKIKYHQFFFITLINETADVYHQYAYEKYGAEEKNYLQDAITYCEKAINFLCHHFNKDRLFKSQQKRMAAYKLNLADLFDEYADQLPEDDHENKIKYYRLAMAALDDVSPDWFSDNDIVREGLIVSDSSIAYCNYALALADKKEFPAAISAFLMAINLQSSNVKYPDYELSTEGYRLDYAEVLYVAALSLDHQNAKKLEYLEEARKQMRMVSATPLTEHFKRLTIKVMAAMTECNKPVQSEADEGDCKPSPQKRRRVESSLKLGR